MAASGRVYAGVFLVSASALAFEVALTRFFSIALWYHFAFMIVSIALLGFAGSGVVLHHLKVPAAKTCEHLAASSMLCALTCVIGYVIGNQIPFDTQQLTWSPLQIIYLAAYMILFTLPFLCSGYCVGLALTNLADQGSIVYAGSLTGSGFGALAAVALLSKADVGVLVLAVAFLSAVSAACLSLHTRFYKLAVLLAVLLACMMPLHNHLAIKVSPYKPLAQALRHPGARVLSTSWGPTGRVDVVETPAARHAPGLSLRYGGQLPGGYAVFLDGGEMDVIPTTNDTSYLPHMPSALAYLLKENPRVLLLGYSGIDVLSAQHFRSSSVTIVEPNRQLIEEVKSHSDILAAGNIKVVVEQPRSYLRRVDDEYDVIVLPLYGNAYSSSTSLQGLNENYKLTVEAFRDYINHLRPGGVFTSTHWLENPPRDNIRVVSLAVGALGGADGTAAYRTLTTHNLIIKEGGLSAADKQVIRGFCGERGYDLIHLPGIRPGEVNVHNVFPDPLYYQLTKALIEDAESFPENYMFDVSPVYDSNPYFSNYFRWGKAREIYGSLRGRWEAFLEGGFTVNIVFVFVVLLSAAMVLPTALKGGLPAGGWGTLGYFAFIGLAYMFNEVVFIQRFILFLGEPVYSVALVVSALLFSSGVGSLFSGRLSQRRLKVVLSCVALSSLLYIILLPTAFDLLLKQPLVVRALASAALLAPVGFLMGMPFPLALRSAGEITPLAWAVNGCASVVGAVAVVLIAIAFGYDTVQALAAVAYLLALASLLAPARS